MDHGKLLDLTINESPTDSSNQVNLDPVNLMDISVNGMNLALYDVSREQNESTSHSQHTFDSTMNESLGILHESMLAKSFLTSPSPSRARLRGLSATSEAKKRKFVLTPGDPMVLGESPNGRINRLIARAKATVRPLRSTPMQLNRSMNNLAATPQPSASTSKTYKTRLDFSEEAESIPDLRITRPNTPPLNQSFSLSRRKSASFASLSMIKDDECEDLLAVQIDLEESVPSDDEWGLPNLSKSFRASCSPAVDRTQIDYIKQTLKNIRNSDAQETLLSTYTADPTSEGQNLNLTFSKNEELSSPLVPKSSEKLRSGASSPLVRPLDSSTEVCLGRISPAVTAKKNSTFEIKRKISAGGTTGNLTFELKNTTFEVEAKNTSFEVEPKNTTFEVEAKNTTFDIELKNTTFDVEPKNTTYEVEPKNTTYEVEPKNTTYEVEPKNTTFEVAPKNTTFDVEQKGTTFSKVNSLNHSVIETPQSAGFKSGFGDWDITDVIDRYKKLKSSSESQINLTPQDANPTIKMTPHHRRAITEMLKNSDNFVLKKKKVKDVHSNPVRAVVPMEDIDKIQPLDDDVILAQSNPAPINLKRPLRKSLSMSCSSLSSFDSFCEIQPPICMSTPDNKADSKLSTSINKQVNDSKASVKSDAPTTSMMRTRTSLMPKKLPTTSSVSARFSNVTLSSKNTSQVQPGSSAKNKAKIPVLLSKPKVEPKKLNISKPTNLIVPRLPLSQRPNNQQPNESCTSKTSSTFKNTSARTFKNTSNNTSTGKNTSQIQLRNSSVRMSVKKK